MTFTDALAAAFKDSDRITRTSWRNRNVFCYVVDGKLCIRGVDAGGMPHPWTISESDYFAEDWEVVTDG